MISDERAQHIAILSMPRSGSSYLASLLQKSGLKPIDMGKPLVISPSPFNPDGYHEDAYLTLLNDQLIRLYYGKQYSFLHAPPLVVKSLHDPSSAIEERAPDIPTDYSQNVRSYTGADWDTWGITRMLPGQKWYKCYSRFALDTPSGISQALAGLLHFLQTSRESLVIKDPRMAFVLPMIDPQRIIDLKIIYLQREPAHTLLSMRRHYGPRIFTGRVYRRHEWVSNHFNYRIGPQTYDEYRQLYNDHIERSSDGREVIHVDLDSLTGGLTDQLRRFIS